MSKIPDEARAISKLALQELDALKTVDDIKARITSTQPLKVEIFAKLRDLEHHETGFTDGNRHLHHQFVDFKVTKERQVAPGFYDKKAVPDAQVQPANVKEPMWALSGVGIYRKVRDA